MKISVLSRREFGKSAVAAVATSLAPAPGLWGAAAIDSTVKGVRLGAVTSSFAGRVFLPPPGRGGPSGPANGGRGGGYNGRINLGQSIDDSIDDTLDSCTQTGIGCIELANGYLEPRFLDGAGVGTGQAPETITPEYQKSREIIRQWRLNTPASHFQNIRKKFDAVGVTLYSMSYTFGDDMSDEEIDAVFRQMQALGLKVFETDRTRVAMASRMVPYAEKYKITPAWRTHAQSSDPNEVSSPDSLTRVLARSTQFMVCLDVGHFADGGNDPFAWFQQNHDRISHIHFKDWTAIGGGHPAELGEGVLHVADMLKLTRDNQYPIAFILDREYISPGLTGTEETKKQMDWVRMVLES